jgi:hypothetical protein
MSFAGLPTFGAPVPPVQLLHHPQQRLPSPVKGKDGSHLLGLGFVDAQLAAPWLDVVAQDRHATRPFPLAPRRGNLVPSPLGNDFPLELGEGKQHVHDQPAHRRGGVKLLRDCHEGHPVPTEHFHHAGEIEQRAAEAIHFVDHHAIDLAGGDVGQESLQRRTFHVAAREATVVITVVQCHPALVLLAGDIGQGRFTLGVQRIEILVQPFFGGFACVDGTTDAGRRARWRWGVFHGLPRWAKPKKRLPLQCEPVIALATALRER